MQRHDRTVLRELAAKVSSCWPRKIGSSARGIPWDLQFAGEAISLGLAYAQPKHPRGHLGLARCGVIWVPTLGGKAQDCCMPDAHVWLAGPERQPCILDGCTVAAPFQMRPMFVVTGIVQPINGLQSIDVRLTFRSARAISCSMKLCEFETTIRKFCCHSSPRHLADVVCTQRRGHTSAQLILEEWERQRKNLHNWIAAGREKYHESCPEPYNIVTCAL